MKPTEFQPSCEDVLYAFAVEPNQGREILEQYLRDYPQYAAEIIDLSYELSREECENELPFLEEDLALIDRAWQQHVALSPNDIGDPFSILSVSAQRDLAQRLDVPRQVITAFREHRVEVASIPPPFLKRLAVTMNSTVEILKSALVLPPDSPLARSYKSGERPEIKASVTFEQLLIDAGVSPEKRALLMTEQK